MSLLPDQADRNRFIQEIDSGFSVIAPAGVGKTHAIAERILQIAIGDLKREKKILPSLVVVTYTNKAAEEMFQRARLYMMKNPQLIASGEVGRLNQAFFGTIHGFCFDLLRKYGSCLGLPSKITIIKNDDRAWHTFLRQSDDLTNGLPTEIRSHLLSHLPLNKIIDLARRFDLSSTIPTLEDLPTYKRPDLSELLQFTPTKRNIENVELGKRMLQQWLDELDNPNALSQVPEYNKGGKEFATLWYHTFHPLREWLARASLMLIHHVATQYQKFRINNGQLHFDDQIEQATKLLKHPQVGRQIRSSQLRVILDEAQDTDPKQFELLTEITRPASAQDIWLKNKCDPPQRGHFCMVGDPQQSIYGDRADLNTYLDVHDSLIQCQSVDKLVFSVTFRCDHQIVNYVNSFFPALLDGSNDRGKQVGFEPLTARADADKGSVLKLKVKAHPEFEIVKQDGPSIRASNDALLSWLCKQTPKTLNASGWENVAILCPRKTWLSQLEQSLNQHNFKTQILSKTESRDESVAFSWFTALMLVFSQPDNAFELTGVLREIFGVSDHEIATYVNIKKQCELFPATTHPLQILQKNKDKDYGVAKYLNELYYIRRDSLNLPLSNKVKYILDRTCLAQRLHQLPEVDSGLAHREIDELIAQSIKAENERLSLAEWVNTLLEDSENPIDENILKPGHIQLLSCHKAKGLEWDTVILPFLSRAFQPPNPTYPKLYKLPTTKEQIIAVDKSHARSIDQESITNAERRESERLLYVAMTRAKHKLVIVDDSEVFKPKKPTFTELLQTGTNEANSKHWKSLTTHFPDPQTLVTPEKKQQDYTAFEPDNNEEPATMERTPKWRHNAIAVAKEFTQRLTPSSLGEHKTFSPERNEPDQTVGLEFPEEIENQATLGKDYGNWWHTMMEYCPWSKDPEKWYDFFQSQINLCPDKKRGLQEIELLRNSELHQLFTARKHLVQTEVPLLWSPNPDLAYEGLIDLLAIDKTENQYLIVDWKTDQLDNDPNLLELKNRYQAQVNVYRQAIQSVFSPNTKAFLYATRAGRLVEIE